MVPASSRPAASLASANLSSGVGVAASKTAVTSMDAPTMRQLQQMMTRIQNSEGGGTRLAHVSDLPRAAPSYASDVVGLAAAETTVVQKTPPTQSTAYMKFDIMMDAKDLASANEIVISPDRLTGTLVFDNPLVEQGILEGRIKPIMEKATVQFDTPAKQSTAFKASFPTLFTKGEKAHETVPVSREFALPSGGSTGVTTVFDNPFTPKKELLVATHGKYCGPLLESSFHDIGDYVAVAAETPLAKCGLSLCPKESLGRIQLPDSSLLVTIPKKEFNEKILPETRNFFRTHFPAADLHQFQAVLTPQQFTDHMGRPKLATFTPGKPKGTVAIQGRVNFEFRALDMTA